MSQGLKVFLACAFGAFVGTFVGLHFGYLVLGVITGGLTGYLSYEWRDVIAAFLAAWRATTNWRPDKRYWKTYFRFVATAAGFFSGCVFSTGLALGPLMPWERLLHTLLATAVVLGVCWLSTSCLVLTSPALIQDMEASMKYMRIRYGYLLLVWYLPCATVKFFRKAPGWIGTASKFVGRFSKKFFLIVHSEIHLLCLVDASIGAAIGYFSGNPLIGTLAGGILGFVNFELLSVRILKLVPVSASIFRK